jgi:SOUL heme-binding protein
MSQDAMLRVVVAATIIGSLWVMAGRISAASAEIDDHEGAAQQAPASEEKIAYPAGYIAEGPLPDGFPPPAEVGKVVEKTYPLCRTYSAEGNNAFMRCFAYLSKQKHEMTAPVIMEYERGADNANARPGADVNFANVARMHFVLADLSLDKPKQEGPVLVADMPKMRVLSIAIQGEMSARQREDAEHKLDVESAKRKDIAAAGPKRVLGYNSPMVPRDKRFWEIQVPIKGQDVEAAE